MLACYFMLVLASTDGWDMTRYKGARELYSQLLLQEEYEGWYEAAGQQLDWHCNGCEANSFSRATRKHKGDVAVCAMPITMASAAG